ncbi:YciI family protein [Pseudobacteriovorax antillogorgiicola]|uniref:Uncharacterized conserved protein YciI, contains a putative active-site phosphohistidine n=1 Tax=Pseudobacteriovorax antillogorgiicola TaxID=1513793 RepID=A0A1Y6CGR4_9BACT|nr:YciI family protein [Pseudobacteriovorax antillogorgiicola]TCS46943.1 uncharacterized protein YciI [Pseudobacteriovorax antillogorgiicola]SMF64454.1 Uncharacterized conserved protein YciI, contains a putative active-site phosphohistidine [Pseudobacteriovorax antillogorgiicola]
MKRLVFMSFLAASILSTTVSVQTLANASPSEAPTVLGLPVEYLVVFEMKRSFVRPKHDERPNLNFEPRPFEGDLANTQILNDHLAYMAQLKAEGTLLTGGPLLENVEDLAKLDGAMFIYSAPSKQDVLDIINLDPFLSEGMMRIKFVRPMIDLTKAPVPAP